MIAEYRGRAGPMRPSEIRAYSNFIVYRKPGRDRRGLLCRRPPGLAAARRFRAEDRPAPDHLDQNVLLAKNVSIFF